MKKTVKLFTAGLITTALVAPNIAFAANTNTIKNSGININLEKRTVLLGDESKINISFQQKFNANTITLNLLCYDMPLSATLNYNQKTNSYEGTINFNKDPEYLNIWEIENITINDEKNSQILNKQKLEEMGLKLEDYNITQEYIISNKKQLKTYLQKSSAPVKKLEGSTAFETAVKISQEGWQGGSDKVILINGEAIADGITATPLATTYDAPMLLTKKDSIPDSTKQEIRRLNPKEIVIIGGSAVVSEQIKNELQSTMNTTVTRIGGSTRHETSLNIAKEIDGYHDVSKIYIANGYRGEVDALTIAAKAGEDKQPIILSDKTQIPENTYNWLRNENLKDAYFIGGEDNLTTDVIHQVAAITTVEEGNSVYKNRVYGLDRHETNSKVMEKFYPEQSLDAVLVARSDVLVDALLAGPLAAKLNSPILITPTNYVSKYHENNLKTKSANVVYKIGDSIRDSVIDDIAYKLSKRVSGDKTVVIDPGHGGADSGATNAIDKTIVEKNYTLDTSLSAAQYLRDNNVNVILTRDKDATMALGERTSYANSINPDLLVSVHYNASDTKGNGIEVFYRDIDKNGGVTKTLATNMLNSVLEKFNLKNRGIKTRIIGSGSLQGKDYLHMIRESKAPAALIECSFIDNEQDQLLVNTLEKRQILGTQIGKGIEQTIK
ncbi:cell wall-binding repeat-containing protein [Romboutsia sp.]|uniref:cell wall-binding repeat-containing protein n=1 Tax=Romboutsia sp. TaxID=1965302 RepID=UPI003F2E5C54